LISVHDTIVFFFDGGSTFACLVVWVDGWMVFVGYAMEMEGEDEGVANDYKECAWEDKDCLGLVSAWEAITQLKPSNDV
jgi:hypothetical protein